MTEGKKPGAGSKSSSRKARTPAPKVEDTAEEMMDPTISEEEVPYRSEAKPLAEPESEVDIYTLQLYFDGEEAVFRAGFLEFPELRVADPSRKEALYAAEDKLHSHLAALRQSGRPVPQPLRAREYPSKLEVSISQTLYRKLDTRRLQERVSLEQLVSEMLTSACDRKAEPSFNDNRGGGDRNRRNQSKGGGRQQGRGGGGGHRRGGYNEALDSRENFMEYVRNLEKGGYKKR